MALEINGVTLNVGDVGTYYNTDGFTYEAKVVCLVERDSKEMHVTANTGVDILPDKYCIIKITQKNDFLQDRLVTAPAVKSAPPPAGETYLHTFVKV